MARRTLRTSDRRHGARLLLLALYIAACARPAPAVDPYTVDFSTFLGGSGFEQARDVVADAAGNLYITGGTKSADHPVTPGAYDETFNTGGGSTGTNGELDIFVTKMSPDGQIIWSTFLGGPNYDRAYAIDLDPNGDVVVTGRAGEEFPVTAGAFQTTFQGGGSTAYGRQNAFVAKLSNDGTTLLWASYCGTDALNRDMDIDANGDIYVATTPPSARPLDPTWTAGSYKSSISGTADSAVIKISNDGTRVLWATYYGGSGVEARTPSLSVAPNGDVVLMTDTDSTDLPITSGAYQASLAGARDLFVARFSADGTSLISATYLGGAKGEFTETHGLATDSASNAVVGATSLSPDYPVTAGTFQTTYAGSGGSSTGNGTNYPGDGVVSVVSRDATQLIASTFIGGNVGDGLEGISLDSNDRVFISGATYSSDFPVSGNAFQSALSGPADMFAVVLSADLTQLDYGSFVGGSDLDYARSSRVTPLGALCVVGETRSSNYPLVAAVDSVFASIESAIIQFDQSAAAPPWLLRNDEITATSPVTPPFRQIFTGPGQALDLDGPNGMPDAGEGLLTAGPGTDDGDDAYVETFVSGDVDPDTSLCGDTIRRLVLYQVNDPTAVLRAVKRGCDLAIHY